ncbi:hypothetical protein JVT61DRAFT_1526 [Boletus reticuloceps]|uniref:Uncharacterized protein n=1 Tax=Boletus reticuloceps TaxID=495285 RepID=A0A8I2YTR7_9AGAM|nr:hypothetical protein JVT61DRAFT_1526 [Boletus reticuloceps]
MSFVALDEDSNQLRVLNHPVKKLPPNPHIARGTEPLQRALAAPSETTDVDRERFIEPREDKSLRHRLIAYDQMSFFTGSASADLQAARLVNTVRSNSEDFLSQQRIHDPSSFRFLLDSPTNAILLEASLHVHWDLYGTFCIVPSESDAEAMLDTLTVLNTEWAKYDPINAPVRPLDISQPPFANPRWDIVVLHPHALLPDRQPLVIARDRTFYVQGQPPPMSRLTWTSWIAYDDNLRSETPPHDPLPPFVVENVRLTLNQPILSSLAMVINAYYKLDQFMRDHGSSASSRVRWFADQMSMLVTAIFYVPPHYPQVTGQTQSAEISQPSRSATVTGTSQSAAVTSQHTVQVDPQAGSPACGTMVDSSVSHENNVLDAVEPPETVGDDGLTDSEFRLVAARARDPLLDPDQRADAAMMLLFGTRRHANPYVQTQQVHTGVGQC